MGNKKTTTETKSNQQTHQVMTPDNPQWVTDLTQGLAGKIGDLSKIDPYSLVAGADPLQQQAATAAGGLTTPGGYQEAMDAFRKVGQAGPSQYTANGYKPTTYDAHLAGPAATYDPSHMSAASLLEGLSNYMSPYEKQVADTALADYDYGAGQSRAQNKLALANDETFGGSGGAIQTALTEDSLTRGRGALSAGLHDQAFQVGAGLSNVDAGRRQEASGFNANADNVAGAFNANAKNTMSLADMAALNDASRYGADAHNVADQFTAGAQNDAGRFNAQQLEQMYQRQLASGGAIADTTTASESNDRANIGTQASIGDMMRQIQAAHNLAPVSLLSTQTGLLNSLPLGLFHGQTQDGTSSGTEKSTQTVSDPMGQMGSLAMGMGALLGAPLTGGLSLGALGAAGAGAAAAAPTIGGSLMKFFGR